MSANKERNISRRKFVSSMGMLAAALPLGASAFDFIPSPGNDFHFSLLGDLHFDKLEHHDLEYVRKRYSGGDVNQVENYSRITRDNLPHLLKRVKEQAVQMNADFHLQLGDFVEGLCGSKERAEKQTTEFISLIKEQQFNRPFLVIKGNHDITGEGANETFNEVVLPWQNGEHQQMRKSANSTFVHKNARFILFDGYTPDESLAWVKEVFAANKEKLVFFCVHQPVVPFNARSNWHIFCQSKSTAAAGRTAEPVGREQCHCIVRSPA